MATSNERRALWFLAIVALSGALVRMTGGRRTPPSPDPGIEQQLARVDSARVRPSRTKSPRKPAAPPEPTIIDLDRASAEEIESLPGIGPGLAARIVDYRDSTRGFGSLAALCRVPGIGPSLINRVRSGVEFSGMRDANGGCETTQSQSARSQVTKRKKRGSKTS